ncbi:MAG: glycoside hydrolase family 88 protein [Candidatus Cyclobacteriaceae bacterium M3_2C_046]
MKNILTLLVLLSIIACNGSQQNNQQEADKSAQQPIEQVIEEGLEFSAQQYSKMVESLPDPARYPRTTETDGSLRTNDTRWWTSGFFPGSLWYLYEATGDPKWRTEAEQRTAPIEKEKTNTRTHDLGFMLFNSFGHGYRLTGNEQYREIMLTGAESLSTRFEPNVGCIRSWDHGDWEFPVIIDNMMNLEFLFWASREADEPRFREISLHHADTTQKHHYREDYSTWHVVSYDTSTGEVLEKVTHQGYSDESSWSRGQAWGLYGYTVMYRETKDPKYLEHAQHVADFILEHPNMPVDLIPYWDYDAPNIPDEERDASAAAIISSALIELSQYAEGEKAEQYLSNAKTIVRNLSSPAYRAELGANNNFILMHSVGSKPANSEVDVPLSYADYYYIESLLRLKEMLTEA